MAAEEEQDLESLEEFLLRAAGGERWAMPFFPTPWESGRLVVLGSLDGGPVVPQIESGLASDLILPGLEAAGGTPPVSNALIEALKAVEPGDEEEGEEAECPVCLYELWSASGGEAAPASAVVREMSCKHRFHGGCIGKWLRMHGSCPVCRHQMPAEPKNSNASAG